jgi:5-methylcytosine-specific restriction endonuclease McrA
MPRYSGPSRKTKLAVFERDQWRCGYCGVLCIEWTTQPCPPNAATVDHIVARSAGGGNERTNLVTACFECNQAKGGHHRLHDHSEASKNLAVAYALARALAAIPSA